MSRQPASPPPALIGRLEVETPEHVRLDFELAGVGSRLEAAIHDTVVMVLIAIALTVVLLLATPLTGSASMIVLGLAWGLGSVAYFTFYEAFRQGQTPGKRRSGIRVVQVTGHPVTFSAALLRNLLRVADFLPPPYLSGMLLVIFHPRSQRLGDMVAGTVVVRDRPEVAAAPEEAQERIRPAVPAGAPVEGELVGPGLADDEWRLLSGFRQRVGELELEVQLRLERQLAARFGERYPVRPASAAAFLDALFRTESARRAGKLGAVRQGRGAAGTRLAGTQGSRWSAFEQLAARAARNGLDDLDASELPEFAARYREVAADLARARTYGADPATQSRLERMVAAGHNQLYHDDQRSLARIGAVILRECPAAVWRSRRVVALALLLLFGPAAAAFTAIRERPSLAQEVLPDGMLERAEAGHVRSAQGLGYFEADEAVRPAIAGQIIGNNIKVAFNCFAGGVFLGVGSLVMLAYNGLSLGATAGHFTNEGLGKYLLSFILGHGILELFAIAVAGAAGFLLGLAVLAPGDLARSEALMIRGRIAARMIGAVVVLLLVAGLIEGLASASGASFAYRVAISSASAVFLALYLFNGARWARTLDVP